MMKFLLPVFAGILMLIPNLNFGQAPDLGVASSFALFTSVGAFEVTGATTVVTGDVGTNVGAFDGFPPGVLIGQIHVADGVSSQAATDVALAYTYLQGLTCDSVLLPTLGNGQILPPNVYCIGEASVLNAILTLDAQGDANAIFVFQIDGALSTNPFSNVQLINGASICNVFWQVNGAVSLGDSSLFQGTIVANGAIALAEGATLIGRGLSQAGAISVSTNIVTLDTTLCCTLTTTCPTPDGGTFDCVSDIPAPDFSILTVIDSCGDITITSSDESTGSGCGGDTLFVTRTFIITDGTNVDTCMQSYTVVDDEVPVIFGCPASITVQCDNLVPVATTAGISATDNCSNPVAITFEGDVLSSQTCPDRYILIRTYRATDDCGNSSSCTQQITVFDSTPPTITCPLATTVQCASLVPAPAPTSIAASDNCGGGATVTFIADITTNQTCANRYTITRTYRATDDCGNSSTCTQQITVFDNTPPTITCPVATTVQCASLVPAPAPLSLVASDNCGGGTTVTFVADITTNQTCANRYIVTRTYRATDVCGNSSSCTQQITVFDDTPPTITCPLAVTVQCASLVPAPAPLSLVSSDNCGGGTTVIFVADITTNQTCANRYIINRTYRATDVCGNSSTCTQQITVFDNTPPTITCPLALTFQCASQVPAPAPQSIVSSDNCGGTTVVTFVSDAITNQTCVNRFNLRRTYRATDACGNSSTCTQTITVFDNTPPTIACPANVTVQCAGLVPPVNLALTTTDNCGTATVTLQSAVITNQTCVNRFTLTRTYRATDACGNFATCTQVITVFDNTAPLITFLNPLLVQGGTFEVQCFGQDPTWDIPVFDAQSINATDNCGGAVTVTFNQVVIDEGNCEEDGFITRSRLTWTATDVCGNSSNAFVFMNLVDTIPPVILGIPADITVNCDAIPEPPLMLIATDECLCACVILVEDSPLLPGCQNGQVMVRSWTATDACGNQSIETQNITLVSDEGPALQMLQAQLIGTPNGSLISYTCNEGGIPQFFDSLNVNSVVSPPGCGGATIITFNSEDIISSNCDFFGYIEQRIFRWDAIDVCGNTSSMEITVHLIDDEEPVITGLPSITCIGDQLLDDVEATDNCGSASIRFWDVNIPNSCGTGMAIRRTYEAFDDCGNMSRDTVMIVPDGQIQQTLQFVDAEMAALNPGEIMTIDCQGNGEYYTSFGPDDVFSENACNVGVVITFSERLVTQADCQVDSLIGLIELKWTATDPCGNTSELIVMANVVDVSAPVLNHFSPVMTIGCDDLMPEIFASDNCGEAVITIADEIVSSDCAFIYDVIRHITVTDPCGNRMERTQIIHVGNGGGPVFQGIEPHICDDLTIPPVTAFDECAEEFVEVTMVEDTLDMPCRDGLVIRRTWMATDICGNISTSSQTIIINDQTPPEILVPSWSIIRKYMDQLGNQIFLSQEDLMKLLNELNAYSVFISDECDQEIIPVLTVDTLFANDCILDGYVERRVYTWVASDICFNTASITFTIDIMDDVPPVFDIVPDDTMIVCVPLFDAPTLTAQQSDVVFTQTILPGEPGEFIVTRTWVATDSCGNTSEIVQQITWIPDTFLDCEILAPELLECNSHGVVIGSVVTGGLGTITYDWEVVGEKCFIQGGQGTPEITIYVGWTDVKIILTITDAFGCISMCMITLDCNGLSTTMNSPDQVIRSVETLPVDKAELNSGEQVQLLNLRPNPANDMFDLSFSSLIDQDIEFTMVNFFGQTVLTDQVIAKKGLNNHRFEVGHILPGGYLLQMKSNNELSTRVIMIVR